MTDITRRHFYCLAKESNLQILDPYKHGRSNKLFFYPHLKEAIDNMPSFAENEIYSVYVPTLIDKLKIHDAEYGVMVADEPIRVKFCGRCRIEKGADYFDRFEERLIVDESAINLAKVINDEYRDQGPLKDTEDFSYLLDHTPLDRIYLSSDWHLFKNKYKKEKNLVDTDKILDWCQDNIKPSDVFIYLGDISYRFASLKDQEKSSKIMKSIPGHKCLILGNHDTFIGQNYYKDAGFDYVFEEYQWRDIIFSHRPLKMELDQDKLNIHGHMHEEVTYRTSSGDHHVNVYPYFYNNKPVNLKFILDHKDDLMKDHVWEPNYGYGEGALPNGDYFRSSKSSSSFIINEIAKYKHESRSRSIVYFSRNINSSTIRDMVERLSRYLKGKVAIKLHFGEKGNNNYLDPKLLKDTVKLMSDKMFPYDLVDCNTIYGGSRDKTEDHLKVAKEHHFSDKYNVKILDANGGMMLSNPEYNKIEKEISKLDDNDDIKQYQLKSTPGIHIKEIDIGTDLKDYDSMIVYTHFKGHEMAGFGGSIKNIGMGLATGKTGKMQIHRDWKSDNLFLERLAESANVIHSFFDGKMIYINILANISLACDCHGDPKIKPVMDDIGIVAGNDIVAVEQASLDLIRKAKDNKELMEQISNIGAYHIIEYAEWLGMGNRDYIMKDISNNEVITVDEAAIDESLFISTDDLVYNFDKFLSGETNIALVVGFSGSGKSTIGSLMSTNSSLTVFCSLDELLNIASGYISLDDASVIMREYYNEIGRKMLKTIKYLDYNHSIVNIYYSFMKWIIERANKYRESKYVIEGLWPLCFSDNPARFQNICVIIKGTSWLKSSYRAASRDQERQDINKKFGLPDFKNTFTRFMNYIFKNSYRIDNKEIMLKNIDKWRDYFSAKLIVKESV